ncbi:putative protein SEY1 [Monocercomonoides exilis]|uniref:putative protein SEY1 n=1 Tax=Monocercomonoides exilis TaxID=2049356 RepID=UPI003559C568|nr:putative protein SEY1 [Monocercomonoides exilis]|eukprot:MONOS_11497.1-p1 / transcript=MONOS_11497.1 / gene=MONOS_11497 / organism=Monocercomonoides_exilis_PA203 / gene_product=YALI0F01166p / transcript_product=YALI0F01166p / location=Mono_scaffold00580:26183-31485(-) / protein_length=1663 / sequence_SO=supercontig / SO=protein_coding / is_pseudo=false
MVSIMGAQSSGKSTLLNALFDTQFSVMNEQDGRSRTTVGTWLATSKRVISHALGKPITPLLILDVEGTDSRERSGNATTFENKVTLFSIALSEVIIMNVWYHDLGRYSASNYPIIESVFEASARLLFKDSTRSKTLLLFIVRDYTGQTPAEKLSGMIHEDVKRLWNSRPKRKDLEHLQLEDCFDVDVVLLPHYALQHEQFLSEARALRDRFTNPLKEDFVFTSPRAKNIPLDGLGRYAENIWKQIVDDNDLDIPSQREVLSHLRCNEIVKETAEQLREDVRLIVSEVVAKGILRLDLGDILGVMENDALDAYDSMASSYVKVIYEAKRKELEEEMGEMMEEIYEKHLVTVSRACEQAFEYEIHTYLHRNPNHTSSSKHLPSGSQASISSQLSSSSLSTAAPSTSSVTFVDAKDPSSSLNSSMYRSMRQSQRIQRPLFVSQPSLLSSSTSDASSNQPSENASPFTTLSPTLPKHESEFAPLSPTEPSTAAVFAPNDETHSSSELSQQPVPPLLLSPTSAPHPSDLSPVSTSIQPSLPPPTQQQQQVLLHSSNSLFTQSTNPPPISPRSPRLARSLSPSPPTTGASPDQLNISLPSSPSVPPYVSPSSPKMSLEDEIMSVGRKKMGTVGNTMLATIKLKKARALTAQKMMQGKFTPSPSPQIASEPGSRSSSPTAGIFAESNQASPSLPMSASSSSASSSSSFGSLMSSDRQSKFDEDSGLLGFSSDGRIMNKRMIELMSGEYTKVQRSYMSDGDDWSLIDAEDEEEGKLSATGPNSPSLPSSATPSSVEPEASVAERLLTFSTFKSPKSHQLMKQGEFIIQYHTWTDTLNEEESKLFPMTQQKKSFTKRAVTVLRRCEHRFERIALLTMLPSMRRIALEKINREKYKLRGVRFEEDAMSKLAMMDSLAPSTESSVMESPDYPSFLSPSSSVSKLSVPIHLQNPPLPSPSTSTTPTPTLSPTSSSNDLSAVHRPKPSLSLSLSFWNKATTWNYSEQAKQLRSCAIERLNAERRRRIEEEFENGMKYISSSFKQKVSSVFDINSTSPLVVQYKRMINERETTPISPLSRLGSLGSRGKSSTQRPSLFRKSPNTSPTATSPSTSFSLLNSMSSSLFGSASPADASSPPLWSVWNVIRQRENEMLAESRERLTSFLGEFCLSGEELDTILDRVGAILEGSIMEFVKVSVGKDTVEKKGKEVFHILFDETPEGIPRVWQATSRADDVYVLAKEGSAMLVEDLSRALLVFDEERHESLHRQFSSGDELVGCLKHIMNKPLPNTLFEFDEWSEEKQEQKGKKEDETPEEKEKREKAEKKELFLRLMKEKTGEAPEQQMASSSLSISTSSTTSSSSNASSSYSFNKLSEESLRKWCQNETVAVTLLDRTVLEMVNKEVEKEEVREYLQAKEAIDTATVAGKFKKGKGRSGADGAGGMGGADDDQERDEVPWWFWIVLLVFAFNEICYVFRHPFLLVIILGLVSLAYLQSKTIKNALNFYVPEFFSAIVTFFDVIWNSSLFIDLRFQMEPLFTILRPFYLFFIYPMVHRVYLVIEWIWKMIKRFLRIEDPANSSNRRGHEEGSRPGRIHSKRLKIGAPTDFTNETSSSLFPRTSKAEQVMGSSSSSSSEHSPSSSELSSLNSTHSALSSSASSVYKRGTLSHGRMTCAVLDDD